MVETATVVIGSLGAMALGGLIVSQMGAGKGKVPELSPREALGFQARQIKDLTKYGKIQLTSMSNMLAQAGLTSRQLTKTGEETVKTLTEKGKTVAEILSEKGRSLGDVLSKRGMNLGDILSKRGQKVAQTLTKRASDVAKSISKSAEKVSMEQLAKTGEVTKRLSETTKETIGDVMEQVPDFGKIMEEGAKMIPDFEAIMEKGKDIVPDWATLMEKGKDILPDYATLMEKGKDLIPDYSKLVEEYGKTVGRMFPDLTEISENVKDIMPDWELIAGTVKDVTPDWAKWREKIPTTFEEFTGGKPMIESVLGTNPAKWGTGLAKAVRKPFEKGAYSPTTGLLTRRNLGRLANTRLGKILTGMLGTTVYPTLR